MNSKLLFVCSGNKLRSPTAEHYYKEHGFDTDSAGTSKDAVKRISIEQIRWADHIYVMEEKHKQRILAEFPRAMQFKKISVLHILDKYKYMDYQLKSLFNSIDLDNLERKPETPIY